MSVNNQWSEILFSTEGGLSFINFFPPAIGHTGQWLEIDEDQKILLIMLILSNKN
jgi:hypothetical protein